MKAVTGLLTAINKITGNIFHSVVESLKLVVQLTKRLSWSATDMYDQALDVTSYDLNVSYFFQKKVRESETKNDTSQNIRRDGKRNKIKTEYKQPNICYIPEQ